MAPVFLPEEAFPEEKTCTHCGTTKPVDCFSYRAKQRTFRNTCKACRSAWIRAYRHDPQHTERLREKERQRSQGRRQAIRAWERANPDKLRPGRLRRQARFQAKLAARRLGHHPLLGRTSGAPPSMPESDIS